MPPSLGPLPLLLVSIVASWTSSLPVQAAVYSVGPSQPYATIAAAMDALDGGNDLAPGDVVEIHAKGGGAAYSEKFVVNSAGTAAAPIVIRGVQDGEGNLPILDGNGAATPTSQDYWNEPRSLIKIGGANTPSAPTSFSAAAHIRIENLHLRNAHADHSFLDGDGNPQPYAKNAACVHVEQGSHIAVVGSVITACGNGIFVTPGVRDVTIEGNHIYGNGNADSIYEHNAYTEALGITYRYNRFGPLCGQCPGNNLKDRSGGLEVAFNLIQGGNRQLDLVDADNAEIRAEARYRTTHVYGNVLLESDNEGNRQIVHYGGDSGEESQYRQGTLHFYHNTVVSTRLGRTTLVRLSSEMETCDARNNIVYVTTDSGDQLELLAENRGNLFLQNNWIRESYVHSFDSSTGSGTVTEVGTVVAKSSDDQQDPGFLDGGNAVSSLDFRLAGPLGPSAALEPDAPTVDREYVPHASSRVRNYEQAKDLGAYGFVVAAEDGTPTLSPSPTRIPSSPSPVASPPPDDESSPTSSPSTDDASTKERACNVFTFLLQLFLGWLGFSFCDL